MHVLFYLLDTDSVDLTDHDLALKAARLLYGVDEEDEGDDNYPIAAYCYEYNHETVKLVIVEKCGNASFVEATLRYYPATREDPEDYEIDMKVLWKHETSSSGGTS